MRYSQLRIAFQPIWDIARDRVLGYEALMRPVDGTPPLVRIHQAKEQGSILELDRKARTLAMRDATHFLKDDEYLFVNVEPESLQDINLWRPWPYTINPSQVVLEVTERSMKEDLYPVCEYLRDVGVHLAIDDFGSGMSNLWMLDHFTPAFIKLDNVYLRHESKHRILQAVVAGVRLLGATLIVEGVERAEDVEYLHRIRVNYAQGFHLGKPSFVEEWVGHLRFEP